jgi:putative ABC transport system permease protein
MLLNQGLGLAAIGIGVGLLAAVGAMHLLTGLLFGVNPNDPVVFGGVAALIGAVVLAACLVPARRATRIDPMVALRYE